MSGCALPFDLPPAAPDPVAIRSLDWENIKKRKAEVRQTQLGR
jgi:hypothetical protein